MNLQNIDQLADYYFEAYQQLKGVKLAETAIPKNLSEGRILKAESHKEQMAYFNTERRILDMMEAVGGELFEANQSTWQVPPETLKPLIFTNGFKVDNHSGILFTAENEHLKCTLHEA